MRFASRRSNAWRTASVAPRRRWRASNTAMPSGPHTAASPSRVNDLARSTASPSRRTISRSQHA
jgi:hypothetical protein